VTPARRKRGAEASKTKAETRELLLRLLTEIAPEIDSDAVEADLPLQQQLDLDSLDFLNFVVAVNEETGVEIPERDYPKLVTLNGWIEYLMSNTVGR
jgi:acyl carrier protein